MRTFTCINGTGSFNPTCCRLIRWFRTFHAFGRGDGWSLLVTIVKQLDTISIFTARFATAFSFVILVLPYWTCQTISSVNFVILTTVECLWEKKKQQSGTKSGGRNVLNKGRKPWKKKWQKLLKCEEFESTWTNMDNALLYSRGAGLACWLAYFVGILTRCANITTIVGQGTIFWLHPSGGATFTSSRSIFKLKSTRCGKKEKKDIKVRCCLCLA